MPRIPNESLPNARRYEAVRAVVAVVLLASVGRVQAQTPGTLEFVQTYNFVTTQPGTASVQATASFTYLSSAFYNDGLLTQDEIREGFADFDSDGVSYDFDVTDPAEVGFPGHAIAPNAFGQLLTFLDPGSVPSDHILGGVPGTATYLYRAGGEFGKNPFVGGPFDGEWTSTINQLFPGDYNASGQVEQGDLDLVLQNWGSDTTADIPAGWHNDWPDGQIDQAELDGVLQNWGGASAPSFAGHAVPEPAGALALVVVGALACRRRGG